MPLPEQISNYYQFGPYKDFSEIKKIKKIYLRYRLQNVGYFCSDLNMQQLRDPMAGYVDFFLLSTKQQGQMSPRIRNTTQTTAWYPTPSCPLATIYCIYANYRPTGTKLVGKYCMYIASILIIGLYVMNVSYLRNIPKDVSTTHWYD